MARLLAGDDKFRDLGCDDGHRSYLTSRQDSLGDYRFARPQAKRGSRMRSALRRVNGYVKAMIEAIADSKVRRMRRHLELRGIRFDPHDNKQSWARVVRLNAKPRYGYAGLLMTHGAQ